MKKFYVTRALVTLSGVVAVAVAAGAGCKFG
jgi:hypothetical protein